MLALNKGFMEMDFIQKLPELEIISKGKRVAVSHELDLKPGFLFIVQEHAIPNSFITLALNSLFYYKFKFQTLV